METGAFVSRILSNGPRSKALISASQTSVTVKLQGSCEELDSELRDLAWAVALCIFVKMFTTGLCF